MMLLDVLVFWALDRVSREGVTETLNHLQRFTAYGVEWRSYTRRTMLTTFDRE